MHSRMKVEHTLAGMDPMPLASAGAQVPSRKPTERKMPVWRVTAAGTKRLSVPALI
ncbi:hypothetical protein ACFVY0_42460 [Streptomyces sp. NPDC058286]|uniref:hypothetical protein n=1 Tax=Streptomyces sp. NPDC058286 TaxID=3346422 RepID=UPI0036EAA9E2